MVTISKLKTPIYILLGIVIFICFVLFNYYKAQKDIQNTKPAPLSIRLVSFPESLKVGSSGTFVWRVESSPDLSTSYTTIYWGYESSPSALLKTDNPDAVRYPYSQTDYASGVFSLPDTFDVSIPFNKAGRIWFRAYAKVKGDNLWSDERYLNVE